MSENTISKPGEFDALEKAEPDELIFPLLGRDPDAPPTIMHWVDRRRARSREIIEPDKLREELRQCTDAEMIAIEMLARQKGQDREPVRQKLPTYSGIEREKSTAEHLLPKLRAALAEADFHAANALEMAGELHLLGSVQDGLLDEIGNGSRLLHNAALEISPHRAAFLAEGKLEAKG